ncbi:LysR family transcriptional regulator [Amycolatopsis sp. CA-230715]|uniref:LysR family transcriptional regulator n=1 Tax=Amycolatopsis sp. CA-230715 TaxID=2745196 RepID=UPI001C03526E|nr:LysR family transcriptional regulator [Amycolatopsis sp. CA-230715]QWF79219.1 HTH-type transcriptional regulator GltC [Amycolatopsis sp. CA-230715]
MADDSTDHQLAAGLAPSLALLAAVRETGNITRAAELLGVPQPTVSRRIAAMGELFGAPLTRPDGRGIQLTRAGALLADAATRAMTTVDTAVRQAREEISPSTGLVALGFLHLLGRSLVPGLISGFRAEHPGVRFSLVQGSRQDILDRLARGELDLVLVAPVPTGDGVEAVAVGEQQLYLTVPERHRLASRREVRMTELADESFVLLEHGYGLRQIIDGLCRDAGFTPRIAFEGQESDTVRGLVAAGLGVSLLPRFEPGTPAGVAEIPVRPRTTRTLGLAWPSSGPLPPAVRAFRDHAIRHVYDAASSTRVRAAKPVPPGTTSA